VIINISGTSGSGKSHLVRSFISWAEDGGVVKSLYAEERKNPIGYDVILPKRKRVVHIVGPYGDADTAGCDVLRNVEAAYERIHEAYDAGKDVLFEGLFMMNMTRGPQMVEQYGYGDRVYVIQLTDPLPVCFASISTRRERRGEGKLLSKENTTSNFKRSNSYCIKMRGAGAEVISTKRSEALGVLVDLLGYDLKHNSVG
jgi:ABC-type dipeptide/oligopeptide/nickel transport system ATPase component